MRRLTALLFVALLALCAGCGGSTSEKKRSSQGIGQNAGGGGGGGKGTLRIALPTGQTSFANTDVVVAQERGFFREQGLKVKFINLGSGLKVVQAIIAGEAEVGGSSIEPVVTAASRKQDVKVIGAYADRLAVDLVAPDSIAGPKDLKGQPVGIQDVGAFREIMVRYVLKQNGMTPKDVDYRPVAADGYVSALLAGQIKGAILQQEQYFAAREKDPKFHALVDLYKVQPNYFYGTYFSKGSWLDGHRKEAKAFMTALTKAHRFMYENRDQTVAIASKATGFDKKAIEQAYDVLLVKNDVFPVNEGLDRKRVEYTLGQLKALDVLSGEAPSYSDLVDTGAATAAVKALGGPKERGAGG
jgi:ABC-type nitrate/sulfonate/bicarbonate transport system substrate-binding protein